MRTYKKEDLLQYDGKGGRAAYIACNGKVYDVSGSFLWQEGKHQVLHTAGRDLTQDLAQAPHGGSILEKFPVVGLLEGS
ncbi:MAG: cytochrome B5 [Latescibacteria bacterium DG_63]|nr:MAG: cytochrome B5 [Latescibacteria bacterium DG_63]